MEVARRPVLETSVHAFAAMGARSFIRSWYVMLHQVIRATGPVLNHAIYELKYFEHRKEDFSCDLGAYFAEKHELLEADLERVGVSLERLHAAPIIPWIAEMIGRQYYLASFVHPAVYLGFIGLLEGFPPSLEQVDAMQAASGFPPEAFSCARLHAKADVGHREELAKMLDEVPSDLQAPIITNGQRCAALQCAALEHLSTTETLWTPRS